MPKPPGFPGGFSCSYSDFLLSYPYRNENEVTPLKNFDCKQCAVSAFQGQVLTGFFKKLRWGVKHRTGTATVAGRRLASAQMPTADSTWDHWIRFLLSDGSEVELIVPAEQFHTLKDGTTGDLTWEMDTLVSFKPEET